MKTEPDDSDNPSTNYQNHPARNLEPRARGYGIGGGYERPRSRQAGGARAGDREIYGPLPHSGYYGSGTSSARFVRGQAGFRDELDWYLAQYARATTGQGKKQ